MEHDLALAVHYYRQAAEQGNNPRGHYNLGYMYEWGLGVKQDFPLAKREYDLALSHSIRGSSKPGGAMQHEAEVPVTLALWALRAHEAWVKLRRAGDAWWNHHHRYEDKSEEDGIMDNHHDTHQQYPVSSPTSHQPHADSDGTPRHSTISTSHSEGRPVPATANNKTLWDVVRGHILSWDSLLILVLTILVAQLLKLRQRTLRR